MNNFVCNFNEKSLRPTVHHPFEKILQNIAVGEFCNYSFRTPRRTIPIVDRINMSF